MSDKSETLNPRMDAHQLRESWQGRALRYARNNPQLRTCLLSVFADNYDETLPFLLHAVTGTMSVQTPFYCTNPKINKRGHIVADLLGSDGFRYRDAAIFLSTAQMEATFRRLADRLKLSDDDRLDLFICARHWVKADQRLDPTMDRRDPDARRLVLN
ncbi:hypothetical protein [Bradyrhizobium sp. SZCCHNRI1073]|uniref:hypothetical protein n=1 Tax=Bradyrhizobium sp. SZCCHNRI1073 TaxID=3057280 RepID=UPI002916EAFA|nr:hypothetical protein [Bradyrhizobium sp. SZCCHNRI1073]